ncbi:MAG: hypothetical protein RMY34_23690 [Aulosira sp. DedQUE10]|nr:hypothetical protein [Aulosira sp. DedQUE10]
MKVPALNVQVGDRIFAYCNNRMQTCTVKRILDPDQANITLSVFTDGQYRRAVVRIIQFRSDALVDLVS